MANFLSKHTGFKCKWTRKWARKERHKTTLHLHNIKTKPTNRKLEDERNCLGNCVSEKENKSYTVVLHTLRRCCFCLRTTVIIKNELHPRQFEPAIFMEIKDFVVVSSQVSNRILFKPEVPTLGLLYPHLSVHK